MQTDVPVIVTSLFLLFRSLKINHAEHLDVFGKASYHVQQSDCSPPISLKARLNVGDYHPHYMMITVNLCLGGIGVSKARF